MGYSASAFARNKREASSIISRNGPKGLSELSTVSRMFTVRYADGGREVTWTRASILSIIDTKIEDSGSDDIAEDASSSTYRGSTNRKPAAKQAKQAASGTLLRAPKTARLDFSVNGFLDLLVNALHAETMELTFDYFLMHRLCWSLLRKINDACRGQLLQMYGGGYLEVESQLPFIAGYIFMACTRTSQVANLLLPKRHGSEVSSRVLQTAAQVVQEMLDSGIGRLAAAMLEKSCGCMIDISSFEEAIEGNPLDSNVL